MVNIAWIFLTLKPTVWTVTLQLTRHFHVLSLCRQCSMIFHGSLCLVQNLLRWLNWPWWELWLYNGQDSAYVQRSWSVPRIGSADLGMFWQGVGRPLQHCHQHFAYCGTAVHPTGRGCFGPTTRLTTGFTTSYMPACCPKLASNTFVSTTASTSGWNFLVTFSPKPAVPNEIWQPQPGHLCLWVCPAQKLSDLAV